MIKNVKIIAITTIIALLAVVCIPLTQVFATNKTVYLNQDMSSEENVSADTDIEEYIDTKETEFLADCAEAGVTEEDLGDISQYFISSIEDGQYQYIRVVGGMGDETSTTIGYELVRVFKDKKKITNATVTIIPPEAGDEVTAETIETEYGSYVETTPGPSFTLPDDANYESDWENYITAYPSEKPEGFDEAFVGTFEEGKEYYIEIDLVPSSDDYEFADEVQLTVDGATSYELCEFNGPSQLMFYAKVKAVAADEEDEDDEDDEEDVEDEDEDEDVDEEDVDEEDVDEEDNEEPIDDEETGLYKILETSDTKYIKGSNKELTITSNGELAKLTGLKLNGEDLPEGSHTKKSGSTIVTLKPEYLDTLADGLYKLQFIYSDGDATAVFRIAETDTEDEPTIIYDAIEGKAIKNNSMVNPQTGDSVLPITIIMISSVLGIAIIRKRK